MLKAQASGVADLAAVFAKWLASVDAAVADYKTARKERKPDVDDLDKRLDQLLETLTCMLSSDRTSALKAAFDDYRAKVEEGTNGTGKAGYAGAAAEYHVRFPGETGP